MPEDRTPRTVSTSEHGVEEPEAHRPLDPEAHQRLPRGVDHDLVIEEIQRLRERNGRDDLGNRVV